MKLTKDEIQRIVLGGLMLAGAVYGYFEFLMRPLDVAEKVAKDDTEHLSPQLAALRGQVARTNGLEAKAPEAQKLIKQVEAMVPEGSPEAWFPTRLKDFFKRNNVERVNVRLNTDVSDKELTMFKRLSWGMEIQRAEFLSLGKSISGLENEEPLVEIATLEIEAGRDDVQMQRATFVLKNLVRP